MPSLVSRRRGRPRHDGEEQATYAAHDEPYFNAGNRSLIELSNNLLVKQGIFAQATVRGPVGYTLDEQTRQEVDRLFEHLLRAV